MTGHEPLIAMRRAGRVPVSVVMTFDPRLCPIDWTKVNRSVAYVAVDNAKAPCRLDLRFLVGLPVIVIGDVGDRVRELTAAAVKAGAERVVASLFEREFPGAETFRTIEHFDSKKGGQWLPC